MEPQEAELKSQRIIPKFGSVVVSADVFGDTETVTGTAKGVTMMNNYFPVPSSIVEQFRNP